MYRVEYNEKDNQYHVNQSPWGNYDYTIWKKTGFYSNDINDCFQFIEKHKNQKQ